MRLTCDGDHSPRGAAILRLAAPHRLICGSEDPVERGTHVGAGIGPVCDGIGQHARAEALALAEIGGQVEIGLRLAEAARRASISDRAAQERLVGVQ